MLHKMIGKLFLVVVFIGFLLVGSVIAINMPHFNYESKIPQELTSSQIEKMIELGIIQVYPELPENEKDKEIGLIYQTQYGDCSLYRDIFGRYYCRW